MMNNKKNNLLNHHMIKINLYMKNYLKLKIILNFIIF